MALEFFAHLTEAVLFGWNKDMPRSNEYGGGILLLSWFWGSSNVVGCQGQGIWFGGGANIVFSCLKFEV